jgi:hypothetical protein
LGFLPEDDVEHLGFKGLAYECLEEAVPNGAARRAVLFPGFAFSGRLHTAQGSEFVPCDRCDLLIIIPTGYATTRLDCFYTSPRLKRAGGVDPINATLEHELFSRKWQFWSRHLDPGDWRVGIDGIGTFLNYVLAELKAA